MSVSLNADMAASKGMPVSNSLSEQSLLFVASPEEAAQSDALRRAIVLNGQAIAALIKPKVHPFDREDTDLPALVSDLASWSPTIMGCSGSREIIGYYSPLEHIWLLVEIDATGAFVDAALSKGFPISDGKSGWWPHLLEQTGNITAALQSDTALQMGIFAILFGGDTCTQLRQASMVSSTQAVRQLKALNADVIHPDPNRARVYLEDLETDTNTNLFGWKMRYRLPEIGDDWIAIFTSTATPGAVLVAKWVIDREQGLLVYRESSLINLLEGGGP